VNAGETPVVRCLTNQVPEWNILCS
jgi:hypothetical protein